MIRSRLMRAVRDPRSWVLLLALLLRLLYARTVSQEAAFGGYDGLEYKAYAESIARGSGDEYPRYFNCVRAPLYPVFLVPFILAGGGFVRMVQFFQCLLGVLQCLILWRMAALWAGRRAGDFVLALSALHPILIYPCAYVLTENLFITLLYAGLLCLFTGLQDVQRHRIWFGLGAVSLGLAALTRPVVQAFLPFAALWIALEGRRLGGVRRAVISAAAFCAVAAMLIVPWSVRNYQKYGEFTLAPRNAAIVYATSNSHEYLMTYRARTKTEYYGHLSALHAKFMIGSQQGPKEWMREARAFQTDHPREWLLLLLFKARHFWTPWLNHLLFSRAAVFVSALAVVPLFLCAAMELWLRRRSLDSRLVLLLILAGTSFISSMLVSHVQVRYRIPFVDTVFLLLTGCWLSRVAALEFIRERVARTTAATNAARQDQLGHTAGGSK